MNMPERRILLINQLRDNLDLLKNSVHSLDYSYSKCIKIGLKSEYNIEELESFEALTSRFARTADILTQKVLKSLILLLQEQVITFIDSANFLEKIRIIDSADEIINIRMIRNEIAHEYKLKDITLLFNDVIGSIPTLKTIIERTQEYISDKFKLEER